MFSHGSFCLVPWCLLSIKTRIAHTFFEPDRGRVSSAMVQGYNHPQLGRHDCWVIYVSGCRTMQLCLPKWWLTRIRTKLSPPKVFHGVPPLLDRPHIFPNSTISWKPGEKYISLWETFEFQSITRAKLETPQVNSVMTSSLPCWVGGVVNFQKTQDTVPPLPGASSDRSAAGSHRWTWRSYGNLDHIIAE